MTAKLLLLAMALAALPQSATAPADGAISLSIDGQRNNVRIRIGPDGQTTIDTDEADNADLTDARRLHKQEKRDFGFVGYRRIAALVSPTRRWAGGTVPCHHPTVKSGPLSPQAVDIMMIVTWEADRKRVAVPINCQFGPAQNEIELIRAALDQVRTWEKESPYPWDPAANVVEEQTGLGND